jgi:hypothetical protein
MLIEVFDIPAAVIAPERYPAPAKYDWSVAHVPSRRKPIVDAIKAASVPLIEGSGALASARFRLQLSKMGAFRVSLSFEVTRGDHTTRFGPSEGFIYNLSSDPTLPTSFRIGVLTNLDGSSMGTYFMRRLGLDDWRGSRAFGGDKPDLQLLFELILPAAASDVSVADVKLVEPFPGPLENVGGASPCLTLGFGSPRKS